jgi:ribosomal protein L18
VRPLNRTASRRRDKLIDRRAGNAQNNACYFACVIKITRHIYAQILTQSNPSNKICDAGQHNTEVPVVVAHNLVVLISLYFEVVQCVDYISTYSSTAVL